ncbi:PucR family transcriptional regulator [Saccharopolyspora hattusasensis]|uniref:PucR family transcriptional regulator n=1 Tax=Saccharopolyspora hattusasensis TaxID=1128679 RepID=UPI003D966E8B
MFPQIRGCPLADGAGPAAAGGRRQRHQPGDGAARSARGGGLRASARAAAPGRAEVVVAAELASHEVLLASAPDELRRSYRQRLLADLIEYDSAHDSGLLRTLRVFLDCSGSWSRCAKRLHVHVNTLRYRIQRIEEITGRDLAEFPSRVDFYLALELNREPAG